MKKLSWLLLVFIMGIFSACENGYKEIWDEIENLKGNGSGSSDNGFVYLLTYDVNGGNGVMPVDTFYYGTAKQIKNCTFTKDGYYFKEWNTSKDGSGAPFQNVASIVIDRNITLYAQWEKALRTPTGTAVDLGLPSGLKWATCNIGATAPEEYGDYLAWGETQPKEIYNWSTYKYSPSTNGKYVYFSKYCFDAQDGIDGFIDNKIILELIDDAARVNWGGAWRMPTKAEQDELRNNCTRTWTTQNGVNGYKLTSRKNGNSIFLPAAGYRYDSGLRDAGSYGYYWSSSLYRNESYRAYVFEFGSEYSDERDDRCYGCPVRPVCP